MAKIERKAMSAHCCDHETPKADAIVNLPRYRKILWAALIINAAMFFVEIGGHHE